VFARLWHLTGDPVWRERAEALLCAFMGDADHLAQMPTLLSAADLLEAAATVVVVGRVGSPPPLAGGGRGDGFGVAMYRSDPGANPSPHPPPARGGGVSKAPAPAHPDAHGDKPGRDRGSTADLLLEAALAAPDPATVVLRVQATDTLPPGHPAYGKSSGPAAYVCRGAACSLPVADAATLAKMLGARARSD